MPPPPPLLLQRQLPRLPRSAPAAPRDGRGTGTGRVRRRRRRGVPNRGRGILAYWVPRLQTVGGAELPLRATPPKPRTPQRPLGSRREVAGGAPPPAKPGGRATWGRIPSAPIGAQRDCPAHRLQRIPPRSASAGYCYYPGFPGATGMGRGPKHWSLPSSTTPRNAPPSVSRLLAFPSLPSYSQTKRRSNSPLSSLCPGPV